MFIPKHLRQVPDPVLGGSPAYAFLITHQQDLDVLAKRQPRTQRVALDRVDVAHEGLGRGEDGDHVSCARNTRGLFRI